MSYWSWPEIKQYTLNPNELHLWCLVLPEHLTQQKQRRQALLMDILKLYLPTSPLTMAKTPQGKPYLILESLNFNLSHSQNHMLIGLQQAKPLGLDLECLHPRDFQTFARRFWGENWYQEELLPLPPYLKMLGFYHAWTQTEAWIKYHAATVFRHPSFLPQCLPLPQNKNLALGLQLQTFMPEPKVIASICTSQNVQDIRVKRIELGQANHIKDMLA